MKEWTTMTEAEKQNEIDALTVQYQRKKREAERLLAEMRLLRKQIDLWEDALIVHVMKNREQSPAKREVLCA